MTGDGFYSLLPAYRLVFSLLLYRGTSSVLSLVPNPNDYPVNGSIVVGIYNFHCPTGYFRVTDPLNGGGGSSHRKAADGTTASKTPCRRCSFCRIGEETLANCTSTNNTHCGCHEGLKYAPRIAHCIPPEGVEENWSTADYTRWLGETYPSPTSQQAEINLTTKVSHNPMMSKSENQDTNAQVEHAVKPDWTDFYILTVSSTAVLFFTLSLVLLFLMAVMKARSWYLYRRLPGSGISLCFRGWLSRVLSRQSDGTTTVRQEISMVARTHSDQGTTARDVEGKEEDEREPAPILMMSAPSEEVAPLGNCLQHSDVIEYISGIGALICCADLHFTFPLKKTYVSSCITSEEDVLDTRTRGSPNFILQACHNTVNIVLGHGSHKCCRHRNKLRLTSSDLCPLGQFEAATMEVQDRASGKTKSISSSAKDSSETWSLMEEGACQHEQKASIQPEDILNLYTEIATPFKKSPDLKFQGSLRLYLKNGLSSHHSTVQEKVKLKYKRRKECEEASWRVEDNRGRRVEDNGKSVENNRQRKNIGSPLYSNSEECLVQEQQSLILRHGSSSPCLHNNGDAETSIGRQDSGSSHDRIGLYCIPMEQGERPDNPNEAISESSVEVVVDVHNDIYAEELQPLVTPIGQKSGMLVITSV